MKETIILNAVHDNMRNNKGNFTRDRKTLDLKMLFLLIEVLSIVIIDSNMTDSPLKYIVSQSTYIPAVSLP